jgi:hypothetical protein
MSNDGRIVQVGVAPNEAIALWWKEILEDEDIHVVLRPGGVGYAVFSNALNEHYLLVREDQAELATEILNELIIEDEAEFTEG